MKGKIEITVFTPTYNRAYIIESLYKSLTNQKNINFEWIIVDDGSTDNTEKLIEKFINKKNSFEIKYIRQDNGGKHRAINRGLELASGELFFVVDSDDYLSNNALERILFWRKSLNDTNEKMAGVCGLKLYTSGDMIGTTFKGEYIDISFTKEKKNNITGDKAYVFYTEVFKKFKYPVFEGEFHIAPAIVMARMSKEGYLIRYFNEGVYYAEYLEDGLTKMGDKKILNNFKGYGLRSKELLESDITIRRKIETTLKYCYLAQIKNIGIKKIAKNLNINLIKCSLYYCIAKVVKSLNLYK